MTPTQYWLRWTLAGVLFLTAQYLTVTRPLLAALRPVPQFQADALTPLRSLVDCYSLGYSKPSLKASEVLR